MPVLTQVAEGVHIHESEFCQSNAVAVRGRSGVLLMHLAQKHAGNATPS